MRVHTIESSIQPTGSNRLGSSTKKVSTAKDNQKSKPQAENKQLDTATLSTRKELRENDQMLQITKLRTLASGTNKARISFLSGSISKSTNENRAAGIHGPDATRSATKSYSPNESSRQKEIDEIQQIKDPVERNRRINQNYHELSEDFRKTVGSDGASWLTFAKWGSVKAGETIRGVSLSTAKEVAIWIANPGAGLVARMAEKTPSIRSARVTGIHKHAAPHFAETCRTSIAYFSLMDRKIGVWILCPQVNFWHSSARAMLILRSAAVVTGPRPICAIAMLPGWKPER